MISVISDDLKVLFKAIVSYDFVWNSIIVWLITNILFVFKGGIRAVVWTDLVQVFLMFAGLIVVMFRVIMN